MSKQATLSQDEAASPADSWFGAQARGEALERLADARDRLITLVEANPLAAVGAATAAGFIFARILRR